MSGCSACASGACGSCHGGPKEFEFKLPDSPLAKKIGALMVKAAAEDSEIVADFAFDVLKGLQIASFTSQIAGEMKTPEKIWEDVNTIVDSGRVDVDDTEMITAISLALMLLAFPEEFYTQVMALVDEAIATDIETIAK